MKNSKTLLLFLFAAGLIKAQTPKTVKIGNQEWMAENLGTTSSPAPIKVQNNQNNQTAGNTSQTHTSAKKSENSNMFNCTFQFTKPIIKMIYIDNRTKCCYCNNFATHSEIPNLQLQQEEAYQAEKLFLHWQNIGASEEHQNNDIERQLDFIKNTYNGESNSFEKYAERLAESGQSKTKEQIELELYAMLSGKVLESSEAQTRTFAFTTALNTIRINKSFNNQTITADINRRVNRYDVKVKGVINIRAIVNNF